ncbi:MAG: glycosyltransferase [Bacteroidales bacterium]|jgi:glycosyltransferase involved in cell wall biosynthesis|nr:glycosyltransferase [Bacteroidales bacterium]
MNICVPFPDIDYKVLVKCPTYNHSKFICDALNGFSIQETDFPFICIVVDDASKDENQEVIRQYANENCDMTKAGISEDDISKYIRVPHKTNENCVFLFCLLKVNLFSKPEKQEIYKPYRAVCEYEAFCEGDDFWTDPLKLQKQVDVMEKDPQIGFVYTAFSTVKEDGQAQEYPWCEERMLRSHSGDLFATLLDHNNILTLTVCVRQHLNELYLELSKKNSIGIDYYLFLILAGYSEGFYLPEKTGTYRINSNGMVQSSGEKVNVLCNKSLIAASSLYLNGVFPQRSFWNDINIRKMIILRLLRLMKKGWLSKSEFNKLIFTSFKMICLTGVVLMELTVKKLSNRIGIVKERNKEF